MSTLNKEFYLVATGTGDSFTCSLDKGPSRHCNYGYFWLNLKKKKKKKKKDEKYVLTNTFDKISLRDFLKLAAEFVMSYSLNVCLS